MSHNPQFSEADQAQLSEEDREYLQKPIRIEEYSAKYKASMKSINREIAARRLKSVNSNGTLWVQDKAIAADGFIEMLWNGDLGLPMTYWAYGVLGGIVWAVAILSLNLKPDSDFIGLLYLGMAIYYVVVYVGIWQAATKYTGPKVWAILSKFVVVVVAIPASINLIKWL